MSTLNIVATPIGNLADITLRSLEALAAADFILCEDTRVTKKLLDHYKIAKPLISYHQHSGAVKSQKVISLLKDGKNLALVTDAGTPGLSDPGAQLVSEVRRVCGPAVTINSLPGPSALTAALAWAGAGFDRFLFLGFLPHKKGRQKLLQAIISSPYPVVLYESKHRILKLVTEFINLQNTTLLKAAEEKWEISVAREISKWHESFYSGSPEEIKTILESSPDHLKGEFTVLFRRL